MSILEYVLSGEGVAQCFLKDLESMRVDYSQVETIFWLNEVPCRVILVVALVVGVQQWEKKTAILLDDGSAVVECILKHVALPKPEPEPEPKISKKTTKKSGNKSKTKPDSNMPVASVSTATPVPTNASTNLGPSNGDQTPTLVPPYPLPAIGTVLKVIGKIIIGKEQSRVIQIDSTLQVDHMEEALHWKRAMELHKTKYSKPFTIPDFKSSEGGVSVSRTSTTIRTLDTSTPRGEKRKRATSGSPLSSRHHSPVKSPPLTTTPKATRGKDRSDYTTAQDSLLSIADTGRLAALSLRHPSQLSHRELNLNTFRVYLNFVMLRLLELSPGSGSRNRDASDKGKGARLQPSLSYSSGAGLVADETSEQYLGVGMSYLMKLPDLNLLAERIEREERRQSENRRVLKEKENTSNHRDQMQGTQDQSSKRRGSDDSSRKRKKFKKKLFEEAIRTLFQDGAIIIHNGRSRKWNDEDAQSLHDACKWKWRKGHGPKAADASNNGKSESFAEQNTFNTTFNTTLNTTINSTIEQEEPDEETYIPVTNEVLETPILLSIRQVSSRKKKASGRSSKVRGVSMEEILEDLHSTDGRWDRVRDIKSALSYLESEEMIWESAPSLWAIMS